MAYVKICTKNLKHNLKLIIDKAKALDKVAIVLKDDAYGHSLDIVAPVVKSAGIKHVVVRNIKEATKVEKLFDTIMLLNPTKVKLKPHMHQSINDLSQIEIIKEGSSVELKVDTGMHRNGVGLDSVDKAISMIQKKGLKLKGIFTHFKSADLLTSEFFWQQKEFEKIKKRYSHLNVRFHSFNSAALFRANSVSDDLVRVGIATYGYIDYESGLKTPPLKPVMSLWANKISTRKLNRGQRIGYGGIYSAKKQEIVSTYDLGYADGLYRIDPQNPIILADKTPILGKISMDCFSAYGQKDPICVFDDASPLAKHFNTISYEILTSLKEGIQRVQH